MVDEHDVEVLQFDICSAEVVYDVWGEAIFVVFRSRRPVLYLLLKRIQLGKDSIELLSSPIWAPLAVRSDA